MFGPAGASNGDLYRDDQSLTTSELRQQQMKIMEEQDQVCFGSERAEMITFFQFRTVVQAIVNLFAQCYC